ncbi:MAG TPA: class I SAM-dependent methyltransferase [Roseiflexaceae bacterium]|nr:class I SAM-dependent methyltransferase [Roseiflexaceae bacterium]
MTETAQTSATYDRIATDYAARWADVQALEHTRTRFAARLSAGALVLDTGCGPGWDTARLRELGLRAYGFDRSIGMLEQARSRGVPLIQGDMRALPAPDDAFDGLWACASFLHIPKRDAPAVLREFRRVLRPQGVLYISVKQGDGERWVTTESGHQRFFAFYRETEIDELLAAHGFTIVAGWVEPDSRGRPEDWINRLATNKKGH